MIGFIAQSLQIRNNTKRSQAPRQLTLQCLESRTLMAADFGGTDRIPDLIEPPEDIARTERVATGDYNRDGRVSAADYTVWRDALANSTRHTPGTDGDPVVGSGNYDIWKDNFGARVTGQQKEGPFLEPGQVSQFVPSWLTSTNQILAVENALTAITTTGSEAKVFPAGKLFELQTPINAMTDVSGSLVNIDTFRNDPRFAGIDGTGFSTVIIDTGIDLDHPFFGPDADLNGVADRIVYQWDFADNDADASDPFTYDGHGSNVSSIVASEDPTYTGMAPGVDIIHLKVFEDAGTGDFGYVESALQWVVTNADAYNIASVNMSLGDSGNYHTAQNLYGIADELAALATMDVIVASASGNDFFSHSSQQGVAYPSADPNSLSIGAVYDSNIGPVSYLSGAVAHSTGADRVTPFSQRDDELTTVMAPGAPITGANWSGSTVAMHGTSQASPHISGIGVLAQQLAVERLGRRLTVAEYAGLLRASGDMIHDGDDEDDNVTNTGLDLARVDVHALADAILGEQLLPGETIESGDGRFSLRLQTDGNLVLYHLPTGVPLWATGTDGMHVTRASMQMDGNLVLYDGPDPVWATGTDGNPGAQLTVQNDGNVVIYTAEGTAIWDTGTWWAGDIPENAPNNLMLGEELLPGQAIQSSSGRFSLAMQGDDNLVLYDTATGAPLWATGTVGTNITRAVMQGDGNFVLYAGANPVWATGTQGNPGAYLVVQNDGNVVIYSIQGTALWSTGTVVDSGPARDRTLPPAIDRALEEFLWVPLLTQSVTGVEVTLPQLTAMSQTADDLLLVLAEQPAVISPTEGTRTPVSVSHDEDEFEELDELFAALVRPASIAG